MLSAVIDQIRIICNNCDEIYLVFEWHKFCALNFPYLNWQEIDTAMLIRREVTGIK